MREKAVMIGGDDGIIKNMTSWRMEKWECQILVQGLLTAGNNQLCELYIAL